MKIFQTTELHARLRKIVQKNPSMKITLKTDIKHKYYPDASMRLF